MDPTPGARGFNGGKLSGGAQGHGNDGANSSGFQDVFIGGGNAAGFSGPFPSTNGGFHGGLYGADGGQINGWNAPQFGQGDQCFFQHNGLRGNNFFQHQGGNFNQGSVFGADHGRASGGFLPSSSPQAHSQGTQPRGDTMVFGRSAASNQDHGGAFGDRGHSGQLQRGRG